MEEAQPSPAPQGEAVAWRWRKAGTDGPWDTGGNPIEGPGAADFYEIEPLYASPALTEPEGWRLVPVEPTDEMLHAAQDATISTGWDQARDCYAAMLAASPTVEER
jgi:hypothetical protein